MPPSPGDGTSEKSPSSPPPITFHLDIRPDAIPPWTASDGTNANQDDSPKPTITVTATSHADRPVTIFTWPTVFNLGLAQRRRNFVCSAVATGECVWLEHTKGPKRPGFSRTKGGIDDARFVTLLPGEPYRATCNFHLATRPLWVSEEESGERVSQYPTPTGGCAPYLNRLEGGHDYRFSAQESETIVWWWYGTRDEVLAPAGEAASLHSLPPSGDPIPVKLEAGCIFRMTG